MDKSLTQKDVAQKINEKPSVLQDYEAGKAIPNPQILGKLERVLGVKLRGVSVSVSRSKLWLLIFYFSSLVQALILARNWRGQKSHEFLTPLFDPRLSSHDVCPVLGASGCRCRCEI